MFSIQDRNKIHDYILNLAHSDPRVVAGAVVGSLALSEGDHWSDLDLTFGVVDGVSINDVLEDWTTKIIGVFRAVHLFDLPSGPSIYRVFLLPGCLQFDLSFTPAAQFGATGLKFRLLFGHAVDKPLPQPPSLHELFGYAVHHVLRARFSIERSRYWQAEYWIGSARDYALRAACGVVFPPPMAGASMTCLLISARFLPVHWLPHSSRTSCCAPFVVSSTGCYTKSTISKSWQIKSHRCFTSW
jgi:hypothetical protein